MHMPRLFLLLVLAPTAQPCDYFREFAVDNCTACPEFDKNRPGVQMAICETRHKEAGEIAYACVCGSFPLTLEPALQYYPQIDGNSTKCAESWVAAPGLFTTLTVVYVALMLYALAHVFYIIFLSRICCFDRSGCTKNNLSALSLAVGWLFHVALKFWRIASQGEIAIGYSSAEEHALLAHGFAFLQTGYYVCLFLAIPLYITSIFEMVCPGKKRAVRRCIINTTLWFLAVVTALSYIVIFAISLRSNAEFVYSAARICGAVISVSCIISFLVANLFMYLAVRSMREAVRRYASSRSKPTIVVKMNELCVAIWRFWFPMQVLWCAGTVIQITYGYCLNDLGAINTWVWKKLGDIFFGVGHILYASLLEGKPVPTFPKSACRREYKVLPGKKKKVIHVRRRRLSGLQLSGSLAKALDLIRKYGLESERKLQSPVEDAIESLLSTSTLEVAASPEMDLFSSIEYFLNESKFILEKFDASKLRAKTKKCLEWARDPARPAAATTTVDEAAAIMLYTQQTCLYPRLNSALRDHMNPEKLEPFMPFLRLLLIGLNKLPLMRARVYRGVTVDLHRQYNRLHGKVLTWWAFSSSTMRDDLIHKPTFLGTTGDRTLFSIDAIGVDISAFSSFPWEQEVLLLPGTPLMVKRGVKVEPGFWKFEASVWLATQHKRRQRETEVKHRSFEKLLDAMVSDGEVEEPKSKFQHTDLPHPGWEKIAYTEDDIYPERLSP